MKYIGKSDTGGSVFKAEQRPFKVELRGQPVGEVMASSYKEALAEADRKFGHLLQARGNRLTQTGFGLTDTRSEE